MVDRRLIEQLDDADPQKRKLAIQQLARSKDMEAIRYLEATERSDSDASVRDIARKAIVYIRRQNESVAPAAPLVSDEPAAPPADLTPEVAPAPKQRGQGSIIAEFANMPKEDTSEAPPPVPGEAAPARRVSLPEARIKAGKIAIDLAAREAFNGQNGRAARYLVDAFKQNPNYQFDNYAIGLAETVTGLYKTDAVKAVMDQSVLGLFDKNELMGKPKVDKTATEGSDAPPATWGTAIVDLFMYGLINAVVVGAFVIVMIQLVIQALSNDPDLQLALQQQQITMGQFVEQMTGIAIVTLIVYALVYGLLSIVGLLIHSALIHVVARSLLGGEGTLPNLIHKTALFLGIMVALTAVVQIAGVFLPVITSPTLGIGVWGGGFLLSLYVLAGYSSRIAKAYDFGTGKGCLSLFISSIVLGILGVLFVLLLSQAGLVSLNVMVGITAVP